MLIFKSYDKCQSDNNFLNKDLISGNMTTSKASDKSDTTYARKEILQQVLIEQSVVVLLQVPGSDLHSKLAHGLERIAMMPDRANLPEDPRLIKRIHVFPGFPRFEDLEFERVYGVYAIHGPRESITSIFVPMGYAERYSSKILFSEGK